MSKQRTLEQKRGTSAWAHIGAVLKEKERGNDFSGEYLSLVRKLPSYIMLTGLGQTLAFLRAKGGGGGKEHLALEAHLSEWVSEQMGSKGKRLLDWILDKERSADDYRRATRETLAYLTWLKRFAEGEIREGRS